MEQATLGFETVGGRQVNTGVKVRDWNAQCALVEDFLHAVHLSRGHTDEDVPDDDVMSAAYCVRHMRDQLYRFEKKADELIDENDELREKLKTAEDGLAFVVDVNRQLGEQNKQLEKEVAKNNE